MISYMGRYSELLQGFLDAGYKVASFEDHVSNDKELILRHDVDFDPVLARMMGAVEKGMSIRSTYFFLLRGETYNLLSKECLEAVTALQGMGHRVSLHFDPSVYCGGPQHDQIPSWPILCRRIGHEIAIFERNFDCVVSVVSIHRPKVGMANDQPFIVRLGGDEAPRLIKTRTVRHTYQKRWCGDIPYISDSTGAWRYGHPFEQDEFKERKSIQLLIHPIWWAIPKAEDNITLLDYYIARSRTALRVAVGRNCTPYQEHLESARSSDREEFRALFGAREEGPAGYDEWVEEIRGFDATTMKDVISKIGTTPRIWDREKKVWG